MNEIRFEWDEAKSRANEKKHGVSFVEAQTVFFDGNAIHFFDEVHSGEEYRFLMLGRSFKLRLLLVVHCEREEDGVVIRIISARKATQKERKEYGGKS